MGPGVVIPCVLVFPTGERDGVRHPQDDRCHPGNPPDQSKAQFDATRRVYRS